MKIEVKTFIFRTFVLSSSKKENLPCFVSHRDEFNIEVLHAFVELHEFTDLNLVQALR